MPLYEYRCVACGSTWEALVARSADAPPTCPECHAGGARRLLSTFAVPRAAERRSGPCGSDDCACRARFDD